MDIHERQTTRYVTLTYVRKHFFSDRVIIQWNEFVQEDVDCGVINGFKNSLEKLWKRRMGFFIN